jgi:hypothetical protein
MPVVVVEILLEHAAKMARTEDEEPVAASPQSS